MLIFYLPVSITSYIVYGNITKDNVIDNLKDGWIKTSIYILITGHVLTAFTIILNPMFQGFEGIFNAPASTLFLELESFASLKFDFDF